MFFGTAAGLALAACFNPPSAAVMFSCEADDASACPPGYACESDGCCHRAGSDVEANLGACRLGGPGGASSSSTGEPTGPGTSTGDATTGPLTTSTGDATTGDTSTTGDASTGDTSTGDTSTGDTSTGDTGGSSGASSTG